MNSIQIDQGAGLHLAHSYCCYRVTAVNFDPRDDDIGGASFDIRHSKREINAKLSVLSRDDKYPIEGNYRE